MHRLQVSSVKNLHGSLLLPLLSFTPTYRPPQRLFYKLVIKTPIWAPTVLTKDGSQKRSIFSLCYSWLVPKSHVLPSLLKFSGRWNDDLASYMVQTWGKMWWSCCHSLSKACVFVMVPNLFFYREDNSHLSEPAWNLCWREHRSFCPVLQNICLQTFLFTVIK